jgi:predicted amino acid racemase
MVSGGNSANIPLLFKKRKKSKVNNLRVGEGILLGLETVFRLPIPKTHQDAFTLEAEIIELKKKASVPDGMVSQNAFGETPQFEDVGEIMRGILGIGRQDVLVDGLSPLDNGVEILGASSDHIILHLNNNNHKVGSTVKFGLNYGALVRAFTSDYVHKKYVGA